MEPIKERQTRIEVAARPEGSHESAKIVLINIDFENIPEVRGMDESLRSVGLQEPVVLELMDDGRYNLLDGRRRCVSAFRIGWEDIPAVVYIDLTPAERASITLSTNAVRAPNPHEEQQAIRELLSQGMRSVDIASQLGVNIAWVRNRIQLHELVQGLYEKYIGGKMSLSTALAAARLTKAQQEEVLQRQRDRLEANVKGGSSVIPRVIGADVRAVHRNHKSARKQGRVVYIDDAIGLLVRLKAMDLCDGWEAEVSKLYQYMLKEVR